MTHPQAPTSASLAAVIGIDVGGTSIKALLVAEDGTELARRDQATPRSDGPKAVLATVIQLIQDLVASDVATVRAVGLVVPGVVDPAEGIARYAANLGWRDLPLRTLVSDAVGLPVTIDQDVRAGGLAELSVGAARGITEGLFVALGTGVAGAVITGGRIMAGPTGRAGELGHLPVVPDGEICACGQRGCVETYSSASAIARRYAAAGGPPVRAEDVFTRAAAQDERARRIVEEAIAALARGLVCHVLLMDPTLIVVGGGLAAAGPTLLLPLAVRVQAGLAWRPAPPIVVGELVGDAGRRGATLLAWESVAGVTS